MTGQAPCSVVSQHKLDSMVFVAATAVFLRERTWSSMGGDVRADIGGDGAGERL